MIELGYIWIILLMAIESTVIPLPSELILIPAGYLVYTGKLNMIIVIVCSLIGSMLGSILSYYLGKRFGRAYLLAHERMFFIKKEKILVLDKLFNAHGSITVLISRWIIGIRHVISIASGLAGMNFKKFALYTGIGAVTWNAFLVFLGYYLSEQALAPVLSYTKIIGAIVITIVIIVFGIAYLKKKQQS